MEPLVSFSGILIALLAGAISPGPSFVLVARTSMAGSRAAGLAAAFGMGVGGLCFAGLALAGLQAVLAQVPWLYLGLKLLGGAYLLHLAFRIWQGARQPLDVSGSAGLPVGRAFGVALATQISNPKTAVVYASIFAALLPADPPAWLLLALPPAIFAIEAGWYAVVALVLSGERPRAAYLRSKTAVDRIAGAIMACPASAVLGHRRGMMGNFLKGCRAALPIVIGYVPIAISFGIVARNGGLPLWLAALMSAIVYAGASQFAAVAMLRLGAPVPEIVLATFFLNLRHLVMSLALTPRLDGSQAGRAVASTVITDESFAVASFHADPAVRTVPGMIGVGFTAWASWLIGTILGGFVADSLPKLLTDSMTVALYGLFIGLLVPAVRAVPTGLLAAVTAMAANWAAQQALPPGWAIIVAIVAGASVGAMTKRKEAYAG